MFSGRPASDRTAHDPTPSLDSLRREHAVAILHMYPHVYIDVNVSTMDWGAMPRERFYAHLHALVRAGFCKRVMVGSDQMVWPELIGQAIDGIESAPFLTDERKHDVCYNNAARFLGLPELPAPMTPKVRHVGDTGAR